MNVAFIVEINLDDLSSLVDTASEIEQDLSNAGFEVISVKPWARPSLKLPGETTVPNITTNQIEPII